MARRTDDELGEDLDSLAASDEALADLKAGRFGDTVGDRPGLRHRMGDVLLAGVHWRQHYHGADCNRCGISSRTAVTRGKHNWWHHWLDRVIALIGKHLDRIEGELEVQDEKIEEVRAWARGLGEKLERRVQAAEARAVKAEETADRILSLAGPILARAYPVTETATATAERNAVEGQNANGEAPNSGATNRPVTGAD